MAKATYLCRALLGGSGEGTTPLVWAMRILPFYPGTRWLFCIHIVFVRYGGKGPG